ncbi:MAG: hypothetical protein NWF11_07760 [Candidatus Bathyarchaeota archaeon]|nr:hypothetical protein [Candidatus Bathyarchaeota archaeon]
MNSTGFEKKEVKQIMYAVLAALLCFIGPTYFVAMLSEVIPQIYSMTIGFLTFLLGIFLIFRLVKE